MSPVAGFQIVVQQVLEPRLVEVFGGILYGIPARADKLERAGLDEVVYLVYRTGQMRIKLRVRIDVVKTLPVRVVVVLGHLAGCSPRRYVVLR